MTNAYNVKEAFVYIPRSSVHCKKQRIEKYIRKLKNILTSSEFYDIIYL